MIVELIQAGIRTSIRNEQDEKEQPYNKADKENEKCIRFICS